MRYAKIFPLTVAPQSIAELFDVRLPVVGELTIQGPVANATNVNVGTKAGQPGFVIPGGTLQFQNHNIKNLYVSGNPLASVVVLVS